ncbi:MAG: MBL fold hydrolase, partial [Desulfobacca sp.]|nr:MBL fold hydrolase [Desulfobacca sp.]
PELIFSRTAEESMAINRQKGPAIIIAASGMCNAGRIKHHLKHNLWRPGAQIVITGFQAQGTLGRAIVEGAKKVRIFQEDVIVRAKVHTIGGFSAHADQKDLLAWIGHFKNPKLKVFVIHGEESASLALAQIIQTTMPYEVQVPHWLETLPLIFPKESPVHLPPEDQELPTLLASLEDRWQALKGRLEGVSTMKEGKIQELKTLLEKTEKELEGLIE